MSHETHLPYPPVFPLGFATARPGAAQETVFPLGAVGLDDVVYTTIPRPDHYWTLDEGDAATRLDSSGLLHLTGGALAGLGVRNGGAAIQRNYGTSLQLTMGGSTLWQGATSAAVSLWVRYDTAVSSARIFSPGVKVAFVQAGGGPMTFSVFSGPYPAGLAVISSNDPVMPDAWIHVFAALHQGYLHLWMDGVPTPPVPFAGSLTTESYQQLGLFASPDGTSLKTHYIDEVTIWKDLDAVANFDALEGMAAGLWNAGTGKFWTPAGGWQA